MMYHGIIFLSLSLLVIFAIQTEVTTAYSFPNSYKRDRSINVKLSSADDWVCRQSHGTSHYAAYKEKKICRHIPFQLRMVQITEFGDADEEQPVQQEKPTTYGYEGNFKVGDTVKVTKPIRIWSVKQYMKEGFVCEGFVGKVVGLALYGRKFNSLCSAITPVKVIIACNVMHEKHCILSHAYIVSL